MTPKIAVLAPPAGGFVISALELEAAMRLLGGEHRRQLAFAIGMLLLGVAVLVGGIVLLLGAWIAGH